MTGDPPAAAVPKASPPLRMLLTVALSAWGRVVVIIVGAGLATRAVGLDDAVSYALIPGIYLVLSPPVGRLAVRTRTTLVAGLVIATSVALGGIASESTVTLTAGLVILGFVVGFFPRIGPGWAAMQLPLLTAFAYSAAFPLSESSMADRVGAVLVSVPVYVLGAALLFQIEARRPLIMGAAAAFEHVADALQDPDGAGAVRTTEVGLIEFRVASSRLRDAAIPHDDSDESRAGRLLTVAVQQAVAATQLIALAERRPDATMRAEIVQLTGAARGVASALVAGTDPPEPAGLDALAAACRRRGDDAPGLLAAALADASASIAALRGDPAALSARRFADLPGPWRRFRTALSFDDPVFRRAASLAVAAGASGLVASLMDLSRVYWAVFAAVIVMTVPAAQSWHRGVLRILGTLVGLLLAVVLLELVGSNATLAGILALLSLAVAMVLTPINYGLAIIFISCTISMMYSTTGEEADFLRFRLVDNLVGVAVVSIVGVLLLRPGPHAWWRAAGRTAAALAAAAESPDPVDHTDELAVCALQLRAETIESAAAARDTTGFVVAWTYLAAAEDLMRAFVDPPPDGTDEDPAPAARTLRDVEAACGDDGGSPPPPPAPASRPAGRLALDASRMARSVALLRQADVEQGLAT